MEPNEIAGHPDLRIVGLERNYVHTFAEDSNRHEVIPRLWEEWSKQSTELEGKIGDERYGVVYAALEGKQNEMTYVAGNWLNPSVEVSDDMTDVEIPTQIWARFQHRGPLENLHDTLEGIYKDWLPGCNWEHAGFDLEIYPPGYDPEAKDAVMQYWIAVEPRSQ